MTQTPTQTTLQSAAPHATQSFDYIVIGGGTAGALVANRLTADKQKRTLLIEAGRKDDYHWIHIPVGYLHCIGNPRTDWLFNTEVEAGLNGRQLRYPRGKVLGGCSSINGMIYMRGQARDYDNWAANVGDNAWNWQNSLPDFMAHEDHYKLDNLKIDAASLDAAARADFELFHGHGGNNKKAILNNPLDQKPRQMGGEWRVERQRLRWDVLDAFSAAAVQAGIPATSDFNTGNNEGVGYFEVNQKRGWRWNTVKAFLNPTCYGRTNFEMWTTAHVAKLLFETQADGSRRCWGVQVWDGQEMVTVRANCEVILSAGAVGSPQILQMSGIGDPALLAKHGIETVVASPGVGANLQDHLQIRSVYQVSGTQTLNTMTHSWWGKAKIGLEYAFKRTGPMSMAPSQLGAFTKSSPDQPYANIEYHVQPLSLDAFGEPLHKFDAFTASVCNLNPTSRGTVQIKSADFKAAPAISPNYLSTEADRQVAADSLRVTRRIVSQSALAKYAPQEVKPGVQYQTDEELARLAGDIATTIFHPVGTTKMGRADDASAVVNSRLQVFDGAPDVKDAQGQRRVIANLRVVDAGVMPSITSGNTNSPTLMIAEKAARWILQANPF
jgi:choline dehydrogenase